MSRLLASSNGDAAAQFEAYAQDLQVVAGQLRSYVYKSACALMLPQSNVSASRFSLLSPLV